jgi:hypothetical protein
MCQERLYSAFGLAFALGRCDHTASDIICAEYVVVHHAHALLVELEREHAMLYYAR